MKALITGGTSDIGFAIAQRLTKLGHSVVTTATTASGCKAVEARARAAGFAVKAVEWRFADNSLLQELVSEHQDAGIAVLNAASRIESVAPLHQQDLSAGRAYLDSEIGGHLDLIHGLLTPMRQRSFGRIVFISSLSVVAGTSGYPFYCMAKGALEALVRNIAVDYGSQNIRANVIRPGITDTARNAAVTTDQRYRTRISRLVPAASPGTADQIAEVVDILVSESCYINGSSIDVAGGLPLLGARAAFAP